MRITHAALAALCTVGWIACSPPPRVTYAHLLERAASWAAAAELASEARSRGEVPPPFAADLFEHAVEDLRTTGESIDNLEVGDSRRHAGASVCRGIADVLRQSSGGRLADRAALGRLEIRARELAAEARGTTVR